MCASYDALPFVYGTIRGDTMARDYSAIASETLNKIQKIAIILFHRLSILPGLASVC